MNDKELFFFFLSLYIYAMKYCSDTKKNEILPFSVTRMNVEVIMLRAIIQRKTNPLCYHFHV